MGKDSLQVYCWNIQTNNGDLAKSRKTQIKQALFGRNTAAHNRIKRDTPWVLAILENKRDGADVGRILKDELNGSWFRVVDVGGNAHTHENIVIIGGNCEPKGEARAFDGWKQSFDQFLGDAHEGTLEMAWEGDQKRVHLMRQTKKESGYSSQEQIAKNRPTKSSDTCRNPALIKVNVPGVGDFELGFLHAPGPGPESTWSLKYAADKHLQKLAGVYAASVMATLRDEGLHALLGDFNLYDEGPAMAHMSWYSKGLGPTTCDKGSGKEVERGGRFDRVYARPEMCAEPEARKIGNFGGGLTDHCGVGVALRKPSSAPKRKREEDDSPGGDAGKEPDLKRHEGGGADEIPPA